MGIDISSFAIRKSRKLVKNAKFVCLDIENDKLPFQDNFFDVVVMFDVLEHLTNRFTKSN